MVAPDLPVGSGRRCSASQVVCSQVFLRRFVKKEVVKSSLKMQLFKL